MKINLRIERCPCVHSFNSQNHLKSMLLFIMEIQVATINLQQKEQILQQIEKKYATLLKLAILSL